MSSTPNPQATIDPNLDARAQVKAAKAYAKATRKWYQKKRTWFGVALLLIVIIAIANGIKGDAPAGQQATQQVAAEEAPIVVSADQLITELDENALSAASTYKGKRVTVTGTLSNIDSSGDYFSVTGDRDSFTLQSVTANIDESHLEAVGAFTKEQEVTFTGKVTDVGEIMGYRIDVETIG